MTETHLTDDELVELVLGDFGPEDSVDLRHLNACQNCRSAYDQLARTMDGILPAAPAIAPPIGFDSRVLDRLGTPRRRRSYRIAMVVAAAAIVGVVLGAVGSNTFGDRETVVASDRERA